MSAPTLAELRADLAAACDNLRARIAAVRHHEAEANPGNHDDRDELAAAERDLQVARDEAVMASHEQVLALASYLLTVRWAPDAPREDRR